MGIGENIKHVRVKKGMTQAQLGNLLGISYQQLGNWESGRRTPNADNQIKIASALGVPVEMINPSFKNNNLDDILIKEIEDDLYLELFIGRFLGVPEDEIEHDKNVIRCEHLLTFFKQLNDNGKDLLVDFAEVLSVQEFLKDKGDGEQNELRG